MKIVKRGFNLCVLTVFLLVAKTLASQIEITNSDLVPVEDLLGVCSSEKLQFSLNGFDPDQIDSVYWDLGEIDTTTNLLSLSYAYVNSDDYTIVTSILDVNGNFSDSVSIRTLTISTLPIASFTVDKQETTLINSTVKFINQSTGATNYYWLFDTTNSIGESFEENPVYRYPDNQPNEYIAKLEASSQEGCKAVFFQKIIIIEDQLIYIPNSFSPNGDGKNDFFYIQGKQIDTESYYLVIYDRWGHVVFESHNLFEYWNGSNNNGDFYVQSSVFNYRLLYKIRGEIEINEITGSINLLR